MYIKSLNLLIFNCLLLSLHRIFLLGDSKGKVWILKDNLELIGESKLSTNRLVSFDSLPTFGNLVLQNIEIFIFVINSCIFRRKRTAHSK